MDGTPAAPALRRNSQAASAALFERARAVMPGGSTRATLFVPPFPPYAASASGTRVVDVDGNAYTDFANNFFSLIHGHAHPAIVEAIAAQAARGTCFSLPTESEVLLAEEICARSPVFECIRFANTGTEAVMVAIKAARAFTGRPRIAKAEGAYHGFYDHAEVSLDSSPANWGGRRPAPVAYAAGTPEAVLRDTVVLPFDDPDELERLVEENAGQLAAVLFDPVPSRVGMIPARAEVVERLRAVTRRHGILLIADEIVSFRVAWGGAHALFGFTPDLVTLGKIIGGGMPIGAIAGRRDVMEVFDSSAGRARLPHGGTFTANPITMAAGLASMRLLPPEAYERLGALGDRLRAGVTEAIRAKGAKARITGYGSLFRIHPTDRPITDYRSAFPQGDEKQRTAALREHLAENGILVTPNVSGALSTPMGEADIDRFVEVLAEGLRP